MPCGIVVDIESSLAASLLVATQALADDVRVSDVVVARPWARATPGGATTGASYLTIENHGQSDDRLLVGLNAPLKQGDRVPVS